MSSHKKSISIFLADDHTVGREGMKSLLEKQADMEIVGEAPCDAQAWQRVRELRPDVVIMDISMPGMDGIQAIRRLKHDRPAVRVLTLAADEDRAYLHELWEAGASGYVLKHVTAEELIHAVRTVAVGTFYLDAAIAGDIIESHLRAQLIKDKPQGNGLSEREREVLEQIAWGYSSKEIAAHLGISAKTVETYKSRLMEKLGLRSRPEIVRYAVRRGWLRED